MLCVCVVVLVVCVCIVVVAVMVVDGWMGRWTGAWMDGGGAGWDEAVLARGWGA